MESSVLSNSMLGSQLVGKSLLKSPIQQQSSQQLNSNLSIPTKCQAGNNHINLASSLLQVEQEKKQEQLQLTTDEANNNISTPHTTPSKLHNQASSKNPAGVQQSGSSITTEQQQIPESASNAFLLSAKEFELISKESQDLKSKTRRLQLEVDEKNEIINVLKDELETTKEQNDKFKRENLQLLKDSNRVKFLQDENDFLQDKVGNVDKLEIEIKRLKERLSELDFSKLRIAELEEDRQRAQEDMSIFEEKWKRAEAKLTRVSELEVELNKWKLFSHDLESERNQIQSKLLESIEQETKLNLTNKKVEDEVKRLRLLIKSFEEQRDEEQASTSLILSVADLEQMDQQSKVSNHNNPQYQLEHENKSDTELATPTQESTNSNNSSIKFELDKQLEKELIDQNRDLKQKLCEHETKFSQLLETSEAFRDDLEGNRKLISELRQDLSCEKSLNVKLTNQLASFTRQIKNLDKHYFPMHALSVSSTTATQQLISSTLLEDRKLSAKAPTDYSSNENKQRENQSSPIHVVETAASEQHQLYKQKNKVLHCETNQIKMNNPQTAYSSGSEKIDNQIVQQSVCSSKLSARIEESTKNYSRQDCSVELTSTLNNIKREIEKPRENVGTKKETVIAASGQHHPQSLPTKHLTEPKSVVMSKSTDIFKESYKNISEHNSKFSLLSETSQNNSYSNTTASVASSATTRQTIVTKPQQTSVESLPTLSTTTTEDELKSKRKQGYNAVGSGNIDATSNRSSNIHSKLTSALPVSKACSSSSSPSPKAAVTIEQDSVLQSINHDRVSPIGPESRYKLPISNSSVDPVEQKSAEVANAEEVGKEHSLLEQPNQSKLAIDQDLVVVAATASKQPPEVINSIAVTPTQNPAKMPKTTKDIDPIYVRNTEGSQRIQRKAIQPQNSTSSISANHKLPSSSISHRDDDAKKSAQTNCSKSNGVQLDRSSSASTTSINEAEVVDTAPDSSIVKPKSSKSHVPNRHFVRNSLPSRSVNFGHSRPSSYLDRIRASVTATTTTSTTSSFNEQTRNIMVSQQQQATSLPYLLNCHLEHKHTEKCFVSTSHVAHIRPSQVVPSCVGNQRTASSSPMQSSRQLNALIDPMSHQHLMMNAIYQNSGLPQHVAYPSQASNAYCLPDDHELSEQQIAHLANLQQQHYYHHLQHMHQLHQMHHLHLQHHHMHQKCEQLKQKQDSSANYSAKEGSFKESSLHQQRRLRQQHPASIEPENQANMHRLNEPIYSGGSQFYAPSPAHMDQVYVNMASNDNTYMTNESQNNRARLVNGSSDKHRPNSTMISVRSSPNRPNIRIGPLKSQQHQQLTQYTLPQIDEVNGLPTVNSAVGHHNHQILCTPEKHLVSSQRIINANTDIVLESKQTSPSNNQASSSSSSPTSSTSSHLSPSSASSSSSLNSLTASSVPLNRSALRHSTTDFNRRQYSVERDSNSSIPMTATLSRVGSCRVRSSGEDDTQVKRNSMVVQSQQASLRSSKMLSINQQSGQQKSSSATNARASTKSSGSTHAAASVNDSAGNSNKSSVWFEYGCV